MRADPLRIRRGQYVRTWFDTGAMGATILYGRVVAAGPRAYTVCWESGLRNRLQQGDTRVTRVAVTDLDPSAVQNLEEA